MSNLFGRGRGKYVLRVTDEEQARIRTRFDENPRWEVYTWNYGIPDDPYALQMDVAYTARNRTSTITDPKVPGSFFSDLEALLARALGYVNAEGNADRAAVRRERHVWEGFSEWIELDEGVYTFGAKHPSRVVANDDRYAF